MARARLIAAAVVAGALLTSCSSAPVAAPTVVATTPILGDITSQITACAGGTSITLMPNGADPHDFAASSRQIAQLEDATLIVANGLGLEAGLADALTSARDDGANVLEVGAKLDPMYLPGPTRTPDPHIWFDMSRMATATELIGAKLADATGDRRYLDCSQQVASRIASAEEAVRTTLESVPADKRILITDHDALAYLAAKYDYRIAGAVVPSSSTLAEPSSADLAALAEQVSSLGVPAIFSNVNQPQALADAVAAEAGTHVRVVPLYVESLGTPGTPEDSYIGMMQYDAQTIADALRGSGSSH
jgi:zinc/manganese transport system substrate-binding protein